MFFWLLFAGKRMSRTQDENADLLNSQLKLTRVSLRYPPEFAQFCLRENADKPLYCDPLNASKTRILRFRAPKDSGGGVFKHC